MEIGICSQINFVESLLLMRTSRRRSLALTCLYSLYSAASGERSSFCTFLWEQDGKRWDGSRDASGYNYAVTDDAWRLFSLGRLPNHFPYLPFCLKNWSSNSFRFLRSLFLSSRASWSCSTSSCLQRRGDGESKISLGTVTMIGNFVEEYLEQVSILINVAVTTETGLRGGGVEVGQSHVRRLRRGQLIHGRNETVRVFLHVVQEAEHAEVGADAHRELRLRVPVVLGSVLFLLREKRDVSDIQTRLRCGTVSVQLLAGGICVSQPWLWIITVQPHNALQRWLLTYGRS